MSDDEILDLIDEEVANRLHRLIVALAEREEDVAVLVGIVRGSEKATREYAARLDAEGRRPHAARVRELLKGAS